MFLVGTLAVLVAGCGGASEKTGGETSVPMSTTGGVATTNGTAAAPAASGTTTCQPLQACDLGISTITVTRAFKPQTIYNSAGDTLKGHYVAVEYTYTYGGDAPARTGGVPPFRLSDDRGREYTPDFQATNAYGIDAGRDLIYVTVQPGVGTPGAAVFEVAPEAKGFTLVVKDLVVPKTGKTARISLGAFGD